MTGRTSTFQIASTLGKRPNQPEEAFGDDLVAKKRRTELAQSPPESPGTAPRTLDLDELTSFSDYIVPPNALRSDWHLQTHIADRHLDNFFRTIHVFLPILDQVRFTSRYSTLRELFNDKRLVLPAPHDSNRPQFVCLLYAVLALGALYEDDHADSSAWASWYFSQAQGMLGRLIDASNLELTQAATFLGAYAQHAIKPNCKLTGCSPQSGNVQSLTPNSSLYPQWHRGTACILHWVKCRVSASFPGL